MFFLDLRSSHTQYQRVFVNDRFTAASIGTRKRVCGGIVLYPFAAQVAPGRTRPVVLAAGRARQELGILVERLSLRLSVSSNMRQRSAARQIIIRAYAQQGKTKGGRDLSRSTKPESKHKTQGVTAISLSADQEICAVADGEPGYYFSAIQAAEGSLDVGSNTLQIG